MCLIFVAWQQEPKFPLILLANRDEFHQRPTEASRFWADAPELLAGRDSQAGGTWLGVTRQGRFAAVTNLRDPERHLPDKRSRGELTTGFLLDDQQTPLDWGHALAKRVSDYNGFNLLFGDIAQLMYAGTLDAKPRRLQPGIYGLSNHQLDTPWPKLISGKGILAELLQTSWRQDDLFALMRSEQRHPDHALPSTGIPLEWERLLSSRFIVSPEYGTRSTTLLLIDNQRQVHWQERCFDPAGKEQSRTIQQFDIAD